MPLGGTLISIAEADYRKLVTTGTATFLYKVDGEPDRVGDVVDVVNDDTLDEEVEARVEAVEQGLLQGTYKITLVYPPR